MLHKLCHAINRVISPRYCENPGFIAIYNHRRGWQINRGGGEGKEEELFKSIFVIAPLYAHVSLLRACTIAEERRGAAATYLSRVSYIYSSVRALAQELPRTPLEIPDKPESSRERAVNGCTRSLSIAHALTHARTYIRVYVCAHIHNTRRAVHRCSFHGADRSCGLQPSARMALVANQCPRTIIFHDIEAGD